MALIRPVKLNGRWHPFLISLALLPLLDGAVRGQAQDESIVTIEAALIDQPPHDVIVLKEAAGGGRFKVAPLPFPNRQLPSPRPEDSVRIERVVLLKKENALYEIYWRDIEDIEIYEDQIYKQAKAKLAADDFAGAFMNLSFLLKNYPSMPDLEGLRREFLLRSADRLFRAKELRQTLSALEELRQTAPDYDAERVKRVLSRVAGSLIENYVNTSELNNAKALMQRLRSSYGELPDLQAWDVRFEKMADEKRQLAVKLKNEGKFREARSAAISMLEILPNVPEARELVAEINRLHPMVRVGVMQRAGELEPASLHNWSARRAGSMVYQSIFQFQKIGGEGGRYGFALGSFRHSDDRQELVLTLDPQRAALVDAYVLSQLLMQRADPSNPQYDPSWSAILKQVIVTSATQLTIQLRRPNVLPHALLQWVLPENGMFPPLLGPFRMEVEQGEETSFALRSPANNGQPLEIIEVFYDDPQQAVNDLLRGDLDVIDQLNPSDAKRLTNEKNLRIGSYALPSVHMLVPTSDNPYLAKDKFKRALLYATNRQAVLTGELLNSTSPQDGRLISGPFPVGVGASDPLAYAYDKSIEPTPYNPNLAKLLVAMCQRELADAAAKADEEPPIMEKLSVACPDFEFARVAVQALIQQWANVGIKAEMIVLPAGKSYDSNTPSDLLYLATTPWEPATDIERLLGGNGVAATNNPFVALGLEKLRDAKNWREVRTTMQDLHRVIDYHLPVLPLWQITDRFVVNRVLQGLNNEPLSLYENVGQWRVDFGNLETAAK